MPKRPDLKKILIVGAGPIVIGQACEFDYSGTQACAALKEEGIEVVLVNSNPATIMTDPGLASRTYIEPIIPSVVRKIIEVERPQALLPTMGGQTSLNIAMALAQDGTLEQFNVELIGAKLEAIKLAEDRLKFKHLMQSIGLECADSVIVTNVSDGLKAARSIGFPLILRPAFTLGGSGGGVVKSEAQFNTKLEIALHESPTNQVLIEASLIGWKEFEFEVMRDSADNVAIICSIENFDPMGIHTGDSITVAPAQTLSEREYQDLRDRSIRIIRAVGVESGGSNIQFAVNPADGRVIVIEMNPRVSRSSALASKATGYPIAKIAAKLALGYTLDELPNQITQCTKSAFEPTLDYVVVKVPRFAFEKFPGSDVTLGTQMKSVGEVMAIGRTFCEAFQKALRGLERNLLGFGPFVSADLEDIDLKELLQKLLEPTTEHRLALLWFALSKGADIDVISAKTGIDKWFIAKLASIVEMQKTLRSKKLEALSSHELLRMKRLGFGDSQLAALLNTTEQAVRNARLKLNVQPAYKMIDTCGAEFASQTPYYYSSYEPYSEVQPGTGKSVIILGGGPNRIGQGIEFDYCCVHASNALIEAGYESVMVNCNPETVSTDYDVSTRLFFEPVTVEDVLAICEVENPLGVIVQIGGQTPLNISKALHDAGVNILGTTVEQIRRAEDRSEFNVILAKLGLHQPANGIASTEQNLQDVAQKVGYPVLVRPSFVLGGQAMQIVYSSDELESWLSTNRHSIRWPVLVDEFLDDALEVDVDAVSDCQTTLVAGILEHIERAGIHSGDSSCSLPPQTLSAAQLDELITATEQLAAELSVIGLMNVQFAYKSGLLYVLEVNPRASRTIPFVSKATSVPWAKIGTLLMLGHKISDLRGGNLLPADYDVRDLPQRGLVAVKEVVLPFKRFPGCQIALGPEMRSTGEVMGIGKTFGMAFAKGQLAVGQNMFSGSSSKSVFLSVNDGEKPALADIARSFEALGYKIFATGGTHKFLNNLGIKSEVVRKANEAEPNVLDLLACKQLDLLVNIPSGRRALEDNMSIRRLAILLDLPLVTTIPGAKATIEALQSTSGEQLDLIALQDEILFKR